MRIKKVKRRDKTEGSVKKKKTRAEKLSKKLKKLNKTKLKFDKESKNEIDAVKLENEEKNIKREGFDLRVFEYDFSNRPEKSIEVIY